MLMVEWLWHKGGIKLKRRVVITGLGAITPIGNNVDSFWEGVKLGKNGIDVISLI